MLGELVPVYGIRIAWITFVVFSDTEGGFLGGLLLSMKASAIAPYGDTSANSAYPIQSDIFICVCMCFLIRV